jgi:hypothetical protein
VDEGGMMPININFMPNSMKIGQFVPPFEEDMLTNTHAQKHGYLKSLTQPVKGKHFEVA